jgi:hypothetical protein
MDLSLGHVIIICKLMPHSVMGIGPHRVNVAWVASYLLVCFFFICYVD